MIVLSVRQPWASLIIQGHKPIENRTWTTTYRGRLHIHAATKHAKRDFEFVAEYHGIVLDRRDLRYGGIIGHVDLVGIVRRHPSSWFHGPYGWLLENPQALPFSPVAGKIGLFRL